MTSLLFNIRRKILGETLAEKCEKGEELDYNEIRRVSNKFIYKNNRLLSTYDIQKICSLNTRNNINEVKEKILGNTGSYCNEDAGGIPIPLDDIPLYKMNELQELFTDEEFIHICKTTGWYEESVNIIYDLIKSQKQNIRIRLNNKLISMRRAIENNSKDNSSFKNLTIVSQSHTFYSSVPFSMETEDFEMMRILWCSPEISQSLLYMLETEKKLEQPTMFSFNFNQDMLILNATEFKNESIFNDVLDVNTRKLLKESYKFDFGNNINILCVIEAINRLTQDYPDLKIFGYRNRYDQNELALINFNEVVDVYTIRRAIFDRIIFENLGNNESLVLNFPLNHKSLYEIYDANLKSNPNIRVFGEDNFRIIKTFEINHKGEIKSVYRASCPDVNFKVIYHYDDDEYDSFIFNCSNGVKDDEIEEDKMEV